MCHVLVGQSVKFGHVALVARGPRTGEGETNDIIEVTDCANFIENLLAANRRSNTL